MLNSEFICVIGTVPSYLRNWGKKVNFNNGVAKIQQKYEREREKVGERKFWISVIFLLPKSVDWKSIVAMPLPKMEGKKKIMVVEIWGGIKKKKCYIHNIFTTFSQQIMISYY